MLRDFLKFASENPTVLAAAASMLSAVTAIVAVVVSPTIAYLTVRKQIRANLVSANRQAWINELRKELSELLELLSWQHYHRPGTLSGEEGNKYEAEKHGRIRQLTNQIRLRLNPQEQDSQELLNLLTDLQTANDDGQFARATEDVVRKTQRILKAEWKRVKKGR